MSRPIVVGCYVRVKCSGHVGRVNAIYKEGKSNVYGVAFGDEYRGCMLERITPAEYHTTDPSLNFRIVSLRASAIN